LASLQLDNPRAGMQATTRGTKEPALGSSLTSRRAHCNVHQPPTLPAYRASWCCGHAFSTAQLQAEHSGLTTHVLYCSAFAEQTSGRLLNGMVLAALRFIGDCITVSILGSLYVLLYVISWGADALIPHVRKRIAHETSARIISVVIAVASSFALLTTSTNLLVWLSSSSSPPGIFNPVATFFDSLLNISIALFHLCAFVVNYILAACSIIANLFSLVGHHPYLAICFVLCGCLL
jgi:hypothetical protein